MANGPGVFTDQDLQALYDTLIEWGVQGVTEALLVGCTIEEVEILDLVDCIAHSEHSDITRVYGNLMSGSENHLRGFVGEYEALTGLIYAPLYLTQDAYDAILAGSNEPGGNGGGHDGGGGPFACGRPVRFHSQSPRTPIKADPILI